MMSFFFTIKKAKSKVEDYLEKKLLTGNSATGIIFNLKNNFEWKDKQEVEVAQEKHFELNIKVIE